MLPFSARKVASPAPPARGEVTRPSFRLTGTPHQSSLMSGPDAGLLARQYSLDDKQGERDVHLPLIILSTEVH